ncbi:hypothetical protein [Streptomyces sp.]|uniref:hypothetical protein n=1 Tax=Streptomyces sp. TaxID=1931 RepID=UPI002D767D05|nr:hypothetical protein [Streptomyces sp.]HET6356092.1 hypothetical protein [Streptomyces sp.]
MALTSDFSMSASGLYTKTADLETPSAELSWRRTVHLDSGTGAGKADLRFTDTRTLAASATEDLDLAGSLLDAFGAALTFVRVKGIFISAAAANTNNVVIGAAAANPWIGLLNATGTITLRPGASVSATSGVADATCMAVTAGTGDLLKVANSAAGTSVTYDIVIVGASA